MQQIYDELVGNILPFWMDGMVDSEGGFYGRMDGFGHIDESAPRGAVMYSRILWTFASAYRVLGDTDCFCMALAARNWLLEHFCDSEHGGVFWSLDAEGVPLDTKKQIYAIAFAIYGLSELYRASGDAASLEFAQKLWQDIETHSRDKSGTGYFEAFARDWSELEDVRLSAHDRNERKTMNTHLHILEGYTGLYRVWPDERLGACLRELIEIFLDKIVQDDGHLGLFFDDGWTLCSTTVSYGHDIEASWLLSEAAEVLGDEALAMRVASECRHIASAAMEGFVPGEGLIYEMDPVSGECDRQRQWWVQAEAVVGCFNQWQRGGGDVWLDRTRDMWDFIRTRLVCPEGEWYWGLTPGGAPDLEGDRAGFWKCPYHNGRMCMELLERVNDQS